MTTLRVRLVASFAYVLVLVLVALAVPFAFSVSTRVEAEVRAQATAEAHLIAAGAAGRFDRPEALQELAALAGAEVQGRVLVVDATGRLVADSEAPHLLGDAYGDRPEIATVLEDGRVTQGRRRSETLDEELLYTAVPVVHEDQRVGAVRVTRSAGPIDARVRRDVAVLAGIALAALVLGLALAWLLAGSLAKPLRSLAAAARRAGAGDLTARADVSGSAEQREVAAAFNDMTARLARVLDAQREFVANASHQLRTPLTGLRLRLEAAALKAGNPGLERELEAAEREADRLARLLTALLTLAGEGADPGPARAVDVAAAAADACDRWQGEAERDGRRIVRSGADGVWARSSEQDVAMVLDNLLENALLYSPPATDVTLEWAAGDEAVVLSVLDEGPGVDAAEAERVFERFARGSAAADGAPGTGLGLAIVRALARRWGGDVALRSRRGGGTRAEVRLPAAVPAVAAAEQREAQIA